METTGLPLKFEQRLSISGVRLDCMTRRAGATGTAGTAMAVPVFEEENGVAGILTYERVASYIQSFLLEASAG